MQAQSTAPRNRASEVAGWLAGLLGVALLLLLLLSFVLERRPPVTAIPPAAQLTGRIAYFEFGATADTLWLVSAANPAERARAFVVPHARDYGAVPSLSPDGGWLAYSALPAQITNPGPDSPADLWLAPLAKDAQPRLLTSGVDLLVPAVWTPDASAVAYRRSDADGYMLALLPVAGEEERILARTAPEVAPFPVAFSPDGASLLYVTLSGDGSTLHAVVLASGASSEIGRLSGGLTRDWRLSHDGSRLAFLEMRFSAATVTSQAFVLEVATGERTAVTEVDVSAFGPGGRGGLVQFAEGRVSRQAGPETGFDVPLASAPGGPAYLVRAFSGSSTSAPGIANLTLVDENGGRYVVARGDVTFVGWSAH
jgi:hypothetical protein